MQRKNSVSWLNEHTQNIINICNEQSVFNKNSDSLIFSLVEIVIMVWITRHCFNFVTVQSLDAVCSLNTKYGLKTVEIIIHWVWKPSVKANSHVDYLTKNTQHLLKIIAF